MKVEEVTQLNSLKTALIVYSLPEGADVLKKVTELGSHALTAQPDFLYSTSSLVKQATNPPAQLQYGPKLIRADRVRCLLHKTGSRIKRSEEHTSELQSP